MNIKKLHNLWGIKQQLTYTNLLYHKIRRLRVETRSRQAVHNSSSNWSG